MKESSIDEIMASFFSFDEITNALSDEFTIINVAGIKNNKIGHLSWKVFPCHATACQKSCDVFKGK